MTLLHRLFARKPDERERGDIEYGLEVAHEIARLDRFDLVAQLARDWAPDVICLQETKCPDGNFPLAAFREAGIIFCSCSGPRLPMMRTSSTPRSCSDCNAWSAMSVRLSSAATVIASAGSPRRR